MITATGKSLMEIYNLLLSSFGPQNWWPAETELEMMVGAVLTQNTSWNNVEKAILNLKEKSLLSIQNLSQIPSSLLAEYIRPSGYYNLKAKRLKNLINCIVNKYNGDITTLFSLDTETIREELLMVKGIGLETADSIVLYGAERPLFVVDTYTHRIVTRHGLIEEEAGYNDLQSFFMDNLSHDVDLFKEFHALIVKTGKDFCRKKPSCSECPLDRLHKVQYD
ncbi:MAG: endonuclease III domain-containing protein [Deltaproteobacteria bacterium]|nr:endonuclease III domain-containing protein [Deltaproteobacteria bacterium]